MILYNINYKSIIRNLAILKIVIISFFFIIILSNFVLAYENLPSFSEVIKDTKNDINIDIQTEELIKNNKITIEELNQKVIIHWRGPKLNETLNKGIKSAPRYAQKYHIYKSKTLKFDFIPYAKVKANQNGIYKFEDIELENQVPYYYKITILDSDNNEITFIPTFKVIARDMIKPRQPDKPEIESGDGFVKLSWKPYLADDFFEYQILRSETIGGEHVIISRIRNNKICKFVDSDVINGKSYSYALKIIDKDGNESRMSIEVIGKPKDKTPPSPPQNLRAKPKNNSTTLYWERSLSNDCESYKIYFYEGELTHQKQLKLLNKVPNSDKHIIEYDIKNLKNDTPYYFSVSSVDYSGNESAILEPIRVVPIDTVAPEPPHYVKTTSLNKANKIEWSQVYDANKDLAGYRIYRKSALFPKYILIADIKKPKLSDAQPFQKSNKNKNEFYPLVYEYIDTNLQNQMNYSYYVVAYDKKGNESRPSIIVDSIPRDKLPPAQVVGFNAISKIGKIILKWKKNKDIDLLGYLIYRKAYDEEKYSLIAKIKKIDQTYFEDLNLELGKKYYYRISAFDESNNESIASEEKEAIAKFPNKISFSRVYISNRPYTYIFSINLNEKSICYAKSVDNINWSTWSQKIFFTLPPNFNSMNYIFAQKWLDKIILFSYNPKTLDLYFTNSTSDNEFGTWQKIFDRIELPPNFGKHCSISFEKDENAIYGFSYNPFTKSVYYTLSDNFETFFRWMPAGINVEMAPSDNGNYNYFITFDSNGWYLFAYDLINGQLWQSMCFDKKNWKSWYKFAKNLKPPLNLEKDKK